MSTRGRPRTTERPALRGRCQGLSLLDRHELIAVTRIGEVRCGCSSGAGEPSRRRGTGAANAPKPRCVAAWSGMSQTKLPQPGWWGEECGAAGRGGIWVAPPWRAAKEVSSAAPLGPRRSRPLHNALRA